MGTLFEPTRKIWVLLDRGRDLGSGEFLDEKGQKIGSLHRVLASIGGKIELKDLDGTKVCEIHQKIETIQHIYDVKDGSGNSLGRIKKTMTGIIKNKLRFQIGENQNLFAVKGKPLQRNFGILDVSGKEVAIVSKIDKWKDDLVKGMFNFKEKYCLRIKDEFVGKVDARQLVGFVIAIEDNLRD